MPRANRYFVPNMYGTSRIVVINKNFYSVLHRTA